VLISVQFSGRVKRDSFALRISFERCASRPVEIKALKRSRKRWNDAQGPVFRIMRRSRSRAPALPPPERQGSMALERCWIEKGRQVSSIKEETGLVAVLRASILASSRPQLDWKKKPTEVCSPSVRGQRGWENLYADPIHSQEYRVPVYSGSHQEGTISFH